MDLRSAAARATGLAALAGLSVVPLWLLPPAPALAAAQVLHAVGVAVAIAFLVRSTWADPVMSRVRWLLVGALTATVAAWLVGVGYVAVLGHVPSPSLADAVALCWAPLAVRAFWLVPTRPGAGGVARRLADGAVSGTALAFIAWGLVVQPVAGDAWSWLDAARVAYPLSDVFVMGMVLALLPCVRADLRQTLNVVAAGMVLVGIGDAGSAVLTASHGHLVFGWPDVALQCGIALVALGARLEPRAVLRDTPVTSPYDGLLVLLPVVAAMLYALVGLGGKGSLGAAECTIGWVMCAAVLVRQVVHARDLSRTAERYRSEAVVDQLTGLANRKAFLARLTELTDLPQPVPASVLLIDLDGFKQVNDTFGHGSGDTVLVDFAARLQGSAGSHLAARLGGDEFAVLVMADDAERVASEVAAALTAGGLPTAHGLSVFCSVGLAVLLQADEPADVLRRADLAMYAAKRARSRGVEVYRDDMADESRRRTVLVAALTGAVDRGELHLVYQPMHALHDGSLAAAEVLLRWTHPELGAVPPDEFVPLAEESGDIHRIGTWALDTALGQLSAWERTGRHLPRVFVNVAAVQFTDALPAAVAAGLARHGLAAGRLTLEITESQMLSLEVSRPVEALRETGVQVALDDFGSGFSNLAQIARLPVDVLKLDRDFVRHLDAAAGRTVLEAVVGMARALGQQVVVEGIEEPAQAAQAAAVGIHLAQGYLYSHPLAPEQLAELLPVRSVTLPAQAGPLALTGS